MWLLLVLPLMLALLIYHPYITLPLDIWDFREFLPILQRHHGIWDRFTALLGDYAHHGRTNPLFYGTFVLQYGWFDVGASGWQWLRVCWMSLDAVLIVVICRRARVGATHGGTAGAGCDSRRDLHRAQLSSDWDVAARRVLDRLAHRSRLPEQGSHRIAWRRGIPGRTVLEPCRGRAADWPSSSRARWRALACCARGGRATAHGSSRRGCSSRSSLSGERCGSMRISRAWSVGSASPTRCWS